jgi:hypothetical protein
MLGWELAGDPVVERPMAALGPESKSITAQIKPLDAWNPSFRSDNR